MTYIFLLGLAGLAIWFIKKSPSSQQNKNYEPSTNRLKNDEPSLPTIHNESNPAMTATVIQQIPDMKSISTVSSTSPDKSKQKQSADVQSPKNDYWISPGNSITVAGYLIDDGMIYVGKDLKAPDGYGIECALINPNLKIDRNNDDYRVRRLTYWPSYSEASPDARAAYLNWLSTGKSDPGADIGYVFLYFYSLERRLLYDTARGSVPTSEIQALVNEVSRLLNIYGDNSSFNSYASSLLAYIQADQYYNSINYKQEAPTHTNHFGLPIFLQICLGQMAKDDIPLPADWVLAWYFSTPNPPVYARTPAHRCQQEFRALFAEEYTHTFGKGLILKDNRTRLKVEHRPASKSLLGKNYVKTLDLPDVSRQTSAINKIAPIVQICQDKLDSYSRYLGRNPNNKDTLDAILELPVSVWPSNIKRYLESLQSMLLQKNELTLPFSTLLDHFPDWQDKSKKRFTLLMERLDSCHIGMEPDFRITGTKPEMDAFVILFPLEESSINHISPAYGLAALSMQLAAMVSEADGAVSQSEIDVLKDQIERSSSLNLSEKRRLKVYLQWLISQPLSTKGMKKKIQSLGVSERKLIGNLLIQVSQADGNISASEIKLMEKVFKLLDIDLNVLYSKIHSYYAEPVTVKPASDSGVGFSIPVPPSEQVPPEKSFSLDMNKVASLHKETEHVTLLLNEIFNQDEAGQKDENIDTEEVKSGEHVKLWGLAPSIYQIVQILSNKSAWDRRELEEMAYNKNLMLEGVLEQINEAAFEYFDEPFIEGQDPFEINQEIVMVINQ
ncbi:MAG: TerB N-terminal domain-containing protein [Syntrophomonas sp.]